MVREMAYMPDVMRKKVYDVNENQKVDSAEDADTVDGKHYEDIKKEIIVMSLVL